MTTTVEAVERYLETDLVLNEALARGFVSIRRAARWLIESQDWDATEEAVVSALRRYDAPETLDVEEALHLLQSSELTSRSELALITFPRTQDVMGKLPEIARAVHPKETLVTLPERKRVTIVVDDRNTDAIVSILGSEVIEDVEQRLVRLNLSFPEASRAAAAAVGVVVNLLGYRGVDVLCLFGTLPSSSFLVRKKESEIAYGLLADWTSQDGPGVRVKPSG